MQINVYRGVSVNTSFDTDESTRFLQRFYGEHQIKAQFTSHTVKDIAIGDYIKYQSVSYYVNTAPNIEKVASNMYRYEVLFESMYYDLTKVQCQLDGEGDFSLMTTAEGAVDLIVTNMNRVYGALWSKGSIAQTNTDAKLLRFSGDNCRQVLQTISKEFDCEFSFSAKEISIQDEVGTATGLTFQYAAGLRGITRSTLYDKNIVTRLYAFGAEKNLGPDYRSGKGRLEFTSDGNNYIEENVATYGVIEHTMIWDDIFPTRTGTVTAVDGANTAILYDTNIDFDLNDYLLSGTKAKIHFQDGDLAGYAFELTYTLATDKITLIPFTTEAGLVLPNSTLKPGVGDAYKFLDITLPEAYITAAEAALLTRAQAYLADNSTPRVTYELTPDPRYMKDNAVSLTIGDQITIEDSDLGIDSTVRITELSFPLLNPYDYYLKLSDSVYPQLIQRLYDTGEDTKRKGLISGTGDIVSAVQGWRNTEELKNMVFDADGYFTDAIRPSSIETISLDVGAKSRNFTLAGITIKPNYAGNNNAITITAGMLVHFDIDNDDMDEIGTWNLNANTTYESGGLTTGTAYYLYACCHKTDYAAAANKIVIDSNQRSIDQGDYYYFLLGVLHSTTGSVPRAASLVYGHTLVNGAFITTGKIQSSNGQTYFDLDNNTLVIGSASGYANISDKPTSLAGVNSAEGAKLSGIAAGATLGATWGTDLASIPTRLADTAPDESLSFTNTFLGFHATGDNWPIKFQNDSGTGKAYIGNGSDKFIDFNGSDLTVQCMLRTAASGQKVVIDNTLNAIYLTNIRDEVVAILDEHSSLGAYFQLSNGISGNMFLDTNNFVLDTTNSGDPLLTVRTKAPAGWDQAVRCIQVVDISNVANFTVLGSGAITGESIRFHGTSGSYIWSKNFVGDTWYPLIYDGTTHSWRSSGVEKMALDASGNLSLSGTTDGVHLAEFKAAYDIHAGADNPHGTDYADVGAAASGHDHDSDYSALGHNHSGVYALYSHNHSGVYALYSHDHDSDYADIGHDHSGVYAPVAHVGARGASVHGVAVAGVSGFMSSVDKNKLDGLGAGVSQTTVFSIDSHGELSITTVNGEITAMAAS